MRRRRLVGGYDWLGQSWNVVVGAGINCDFLGWSSVCPEGVVNGRAFDGERRLLVAGQFCDRRLVKAGASVDVCHVCHVFCSARRLGGGVLLLLVLASRSEQQAPVGGKGQASEERGKRLVSIESRRLGARIHASAYAWRSSGHDGRQGHRRAWRD